MIPLYGPYAAALSFIIGISNLKKPCTLYRGVCVQETNYTEEVGKKVTFHGFKPATFNKDEALR